MRERSDLSCHDEKRRHLVRERRRNGIDAIEVADASQRELVVWFFAQAPGDVRPANVRVDGGRRIRDVVVTRVWPDPSSPNALRVLVDRAGDFSTYTLRFVETQAGRPTDRPLPGLDARYSEIDFTFKVDCPSDLDCRPGPACPPVQRTEPEITYLAKDYASFRQLILDRLALVMPDWRERHAADVGIMLVELLAYAGDYLSYYQDAVATEAYLETARQRISVRRHAQLVDYHLHEGCNARTWLTISLDDNVELALDDIAFTTDGGASAETFEPMAASATGHDRTVHLYAAHSTIPFYTWGDEQCCLPRGATRATLRDRWVTGHGGAERALHHLNKGDFLIFEEVRGPLTNNEADADPAHRHVVRLTSVEPGVDPLIPDTSGDTSTKTRTYGGGEPRPTPVVEIEWSDADALPFPLCLSSKLPSPDCTVISGVSVARGNVLPVDHGRTTGVEDVGQVGSHEVAGDCACPDAGPLDATDVPEPFEGRLQQTPLTFAVPLAHADRAPASTVLAQVPRDAVPQIRLVGVPGLPPAEGQAIGGVAPGIDRADPQWRWQPRPSLLSSGPRDLHFVVEIDDERRVQLRFGDGDLGRQPAAHTVFSATYRVGNGPRGNVGAETITHVRWRGASVSGLTLRPRNPLPARGGQHPEPVADARRDAPRAFKKELRRAITANDYAMLAGRESGPTIQRAGGSLRWTGSWYAAQVAIDPVGSETIDGRLTALVTTRLNRVRRMGHDLEVSAARYVPLRIGLAVCVRAADLRGHVEAALLNVFSSGLRRDGQPGFFHPDRLTFGQGVTLSALVAAAQSVPGVASVRVTELHRLSEPPQREIADGILRIGPLEIAQLDNDPSFPDHGRLTLTLEGGR